MQTRFQRHASGLQQQKQLLKAGRHVRPAARRAAAHGPGCGGGEGSTLAEHQVWLRRQRVLHHEPHPSDGDVIEINCGGSHYVTSRSTLRQVKGSLLSLLFDPVNSHLLRHDASGRVFLDHDPAAFGLLLRHLREVRAAAGYFGSAPVVLPAIPPADAPAFRALNAHLGLGIADDDIAAAVRRGAALAAATATDAPTPYLAAEFDRPPASPYASRPAPPGTPEQQQQQRWLRQQWQQQCSPGGQQQQQRVANTAMPEAPSAAAEADVQADATADDWDALTYPLPVVPRELQQLQQLLQPSSAAKPQPPQQSSVMPAGAGTAAADAEQDSASAAAAAPTEYSPPAVQDYYMLTSRPRVNLAGSSMLPAPLRVSLLTDSDMLALQQHAQQQQQQWHGLAPHGSSTCGFEQPPELDCDFDLFCSSSVSRDMMSLSLVVREHAELDDVFVGLTTPSQADQRGLQIPSFGFHQVTSCPADAAGASDTDADSLHGQQQPQQQQRWATGDLVQLVLDRRSSSGNSLSLTVNNKSSSEASAPPAADSITGSISGMLGSGSSSSGRGSSGSSAGGSSVTLPAFEEWVWYIALYRGTQVVAVVLDQHSYAVYTGDSKLKRYLS